MRVLLVKRLEPSPQKAEKGRDELPRTWGQLRVAREHNLLQRLADEAAKARLARVRVNERVPERHCAIRGLEEVVERPVHDTGQRS